MCGENPVVLSTWTRAAGSSPRVRGKRCLFSDGEGVFRLIPAHAGKTQHACLCQAPTRAHPRACGENSRNSKGGTCTPGSSPRMRGKHRRTVWNVLPGRLIPAHAGKTNVQLLIVSVHWAHPRACGENFPGEYSEYSCEGSSPRMRGKQRRRWLPHLRRRLIPAHAGKTAAA